MERRARAKAKEKAAAMEARGLDKERRRNGSALHDDYAGVNEVSSRGKSDVGASEGEREEEDEAEAAAFGEEGVKKKMGVLARMVGMEGCGQPGVVLTEVVRVLKELDGRARGVCSSRKG